MVSRAERILQLKVTLKEIKPAVWRRIQVPGDYTFWDLHVAIQDAMGWLDCHLHQFEVFNPRKRRMEYVGIPDEEGLFDEETLPGWEVPVGRLLHSSNPRAIYLYDFGDSWAHTVVLEKTLVPETQVRYPRSMGGRRKCPPEDCGGTPGYSHFLEAITDPNHEEHAEMLEWAGGKYDPDDFDPRAVAFEDPRERLRLMLEDRS